jgi:glutamate-1-semialdehyde 2,1-aminomutase
MKTSFRKSEQFLKRAMKAIPLGSQTFSKSVAILPFGVSPYFVKYARGSHFWDLDGNKFLDFVNGLACVTLGYRDPDVDAAVTNQMKSGVTFSLPHPLETEVAELLVKMIPCAEMVRFAKNGSDATAAAIRIARAYTGRDRVAVCGYHGWHDWYIGSTTRNLGVPRNVQALTHIFPYNDYDFLEALFKKYSGRFAAVILEPMNSSWPLPGFLESIRKLTKREGALLVFDETITGFRFSRGGAQAYFKVEPDLATFGKGIANGYPLAALAGSRRYMKIVEKIFFSGTFGGETLSLAAAKAVLSKINQRPVIKTLKERGEQILSSTLDLIKSHGLSEIVKISGHPSWSFLKFENCKPFSALEIKTLFIQEVFQRNIYALGTHNLSYAHTKTDIKTLAKCYDEVFRILARSISKSEVRKRLHCKPLKPLFRVR